MIFMLLCFVLFGCGGREAMVLDASTPSPSLEPRFTVALDFGHGGFDGGAVGVDSGVIEAELNLIVGNMVKERLERGNIAVVLTRADGEALAETKQEDMHLRGEILCGEDIDIVISIHMNKFSDRSVRGPMVYYQAGAKAGQLLAQTIMDALTQAVGRPARLASPGNNYVTRIPTAPAALIECGFLSNAEEEKLLQDAEYQAQLADGIANGIFTYFTNLGIALD